MEDSSEDESAIFITQSQRSENVKEKNEKLYNNDVEQKYDGQREETGLQGLSEKVLDENQSEDYNQSVVISTHSTKIVISYK